MVLLIFKGLSDKTSTKSNNYRWIVNFSCLILIKVICLHYLTYYIGSVSPSTANKMKRMRIGSGILILVLNSFLKKEQSSAYITITCIDTSLWKISVVIRMHLFETLHVHQHFVNAIFCHEFIVFALFHDFPFLHDYNFIGVLNGW